MIATTRIRVCSLCGCTKPVEGRFFHRRAASKDGFKATCKTCCNIRYHEWSLQNKAWRAAYDKEHYAKHRERYSEKHREWRIKNKRLRNAYMREWSRRNPYRDRYRSVEVRNYIQLLLRDPCVYCGGISVEVDHIHPSSKGGKDTEDNLAPACRSCNASKNHRSLLEFLLDRREPVTIT